MSETYADMSGPDLIDKAIADLDEAALAAALTRFGEKAKAIQAEMDKGVSPKEFKRLKSVHTGLETGRNVVGVLWKSKKAKSEKGE